MRLHWLPIANCAHSPTSPLCLSPLLVIILTFLVWTLILAKDSDFCFWPTLLYWLSPLWILVLLNSCIVDWTLVLILCIPSGLFNHFSGLCFGCVDFCFVDVLFIRVWTCSLVTALLTLLPEQALFWRLFLWKYPVCYLECLPRAWGFGPCLQCFTHQLLPGGGRHWTPPSWSSSPS